MKDKSKPADRLKMIALHQQALDGKISIDRLHAEWPSGSSTAEANRLLDDLADGVEHTPGNLLNGRVNFTKWENSEEYREIYLNLKLLESGLPIKAICEIKENTSAGSFQRLEQIDDFVKNEVGEHWE